MQETGPELSCNTQAGLEKVENIPEGNSGISKAQKQAFARRVVGGGGGVARSSLPRAAKLVSQPGGRSVEHKIKYSLAFKKMEIQTHTMASL